MLQELVWRVGRLYFRVFNPVIVIGADKIPKNGPYLVVANHASHLDGPALVAALGVHSKSVHPLGAQDYFFRTALQTWFARNVLNIVPIDRSRLDPEALRSCRRIAHAGEILLLFPEGTRSRTGNLQKFKAGSGVIAQRLGLPILPAYISGTHAAMPKGRRLPRRGPIEIRFGHPFLPTDVLETADGAEQGVYRRITAGMRVAVAALAGKREVSWQTVPSRV
jgi:long-chain acyl-CoA synthetase